METIKLFDKAKDGFLKIAVPKNFENKALEIDVRIVEDEDENKLHRDDVEKRGKALFARFGKAKFKDYIIRKDDSYYQ
ncbi:MAG: hypothetical protein ABIN01_07430 [Ferruginibacter sp.]